MSDYADINDVIALWKPLTEAETARANALIPLVCDGLRHEANKVGKNLDKMIDDDPTLRSVAKMVTVDIVSRVMRQNVDAEPMAQESQAALGYSWSGTYAIPGGGIAQAIMRNDLKRLGLMRQQIGVIDMLGGEND